MDELKYRKYDFPRCAEECIAKLEQVLPQVLKSTSSTMMRQMRDIQTSIDEFIFCYLDRRAAIGQRLSDLEQLQLCQLLCEFFSSAASMDEKMRYQVFETLFINGEVEECRENRIAILVRAASLAISLRCYPLLNDIAEWVLKYGISHRSSKRLLNGLIDDFCFSAGYDQFFHLVADVNMPVVEVDAGIPPIDIKGGCPLLVSCFIAVLMSKYENFDIPPCQLLATMTDWLSKNPGVIFAALKPALLGKAVSGVTNTLNKSIISAMSKLLLLSMFGPVKQRLEGGANEFTNWPGFHLALMKMILKLRDSKQTIECLTVRQTAEIISARLPPARAAVSEDMIMECLDRIAQTIQITRAAKAIYGNMKELDKAYRDLGVQHEILRFVIDAVV